MRSVCLLAFVGLVLTASAARGDDRVDVGLLLGSTRASGEGAALQFGRALTYQATFAWRVWEFVGVQKETVPGERLLLGDTREEFGVAHTMTATLDLGADGRVTAGGGAGGAGTTTGS